MVAVSLCCRRWPHAANRTSLCTHDGKRSAMPQHACEQIRCSVTHPNRRTPPPFLPKWDICATAVTRAGGVHARTQVPQRAHPGGAAARRHERGALQLLARQPRVPPGTCTDPLLRSRHVRSCMTACQAGSNRAGRWSGSLQHSCGHDQAGAKSHALLQYLLAYDTPFAPNPRSDRFT